MLWPLKKVHETFFTILSGVFFFELDLGARDHGKGVVGLRLNSSNTPQMLLRNWLVEVWIIEALHGFVGDFIALGVHVVVKDGKVEGLGHLNLHSTIMHTLIRLIRIKSSRHYRIVKRAVNSDYITMLVYGLYDWTKECSTIAVVLLKPTCRCVLLSSVLPSVGCFTHLFLICWEIFCIISKYILWID